MVIKVDFSLKIAFKFMLSCHSFKQFNFFYYYRYCSLVVCMKLHSVDFVVLLIIVGAACICQLMYFSVYFCFSVRLLTEHYNLGLCEMAKFIIINVCMLYFIFKMIS